MTLGVVAPRLKPVKLLATLKQTGASTSSVVGSCWPIVGSLRLTHKSSSKFLSIVKRGLESFYVFGGKVGQVSERPGWGHDGAYYRNRKREAKDLEKV